jgi:hypothetical protein
VIRFAAFLACLACVAVGCSHGSGQGDAGEPQPVASTVASAGPARVVALDAIARLDDCVLGHRGALLDLGDASSRARFVSSLDAPSLESVEREGATWARVTKRTVSFTFYWSGLLDRPAPGPAAPPPAPPLDASAPIDSGTYVEARVRSVTARSASVYLNGHLVGGWSLSRGKDVVARAHGGAGGVVEGENELEISFAGGSSKDGLPFADIDWIHIGNDTSTEPYAAPTRVDSLVSATFGGVSKRALSLPAPGYARCEGWLPPSASLEGEVALEGAGDADVEVRLLLDRSTPLVLGSAHVTGTAGVGSAAWSPLVAPLGDVGARGTLGAIEIAVLRASKGTRVLFADTRVIGPLLPPPQPPPPAARSVVLIVLGDVSQASLSPFGGPHALPSIASFAQGAVAFDANRSSTGFANGVLASMLTGLAPRVHTLEDPDARLPPSLTTIADAARQGGTTTAMFTANPTTGTVFGFARGWDTFVAHSPNDSTPPMQVFDDAASWISAHKDLRFLVVIHARGAHPPWDVTLDELKALAPDDYNGNFDPGHGAEILAHWRKVPGRATDADRTRAWALWSRALEQTDTAFGKFLDSLRDAGRDEDTAVFLTGDIGVSESSTLPLPEEGSLDEAALAVPLLVRLPHRELAGRRVALPTCSVDVAKSAMRALGLAPPASFGGLDLLGLANGDDAPRDRPLLATTAARFALRWGSFVLVGTREHETRLCDLTLEPACLTDVRKAYPIALEIMHRAAHDAVGGPGTHIGDKSAVAREPAFIDPDTEAALEAWGRLPEKKKKRADD